MMFASLSTSRAARQAVMAGVALILAAAVALPSGARAQDPFPNAAIGIIDMQRILQESSAAQGVDKDRQAYLEAYNKETAAQEQALREEQRSISLPPNQAPTPELEEKARAFRQKVAAFEQSVAERRRSLERALSTALGEVQRMITVVADEVAAERGINLVLYRSQVPLFDPRMEMTDDVLTRLNKQLPSVEFPDPASLPAAGAAQ